VLREAEAIAEGRPVVPTSGCNDGLCAMSVGGADSAWRVDGFWDTGNGWKASGSSSDRNLLRYVIEDMGETTTATSCTTGIDLSGICAPSSALARSYRIVVFSRLENGAEVILQTTYLVPL
jgi:type IV pilus assembly protein PilX